MYLHFFHGVVQAFGLKSSQSSIASKDFPMSEDAGSNQRPRRGPDSLQAMRMENRRVSNIGKSRMFNHSKHLRQHAAAVAAGIALISLNISSADALTLDEIACSDSKEGITLQHSHIFPGPRK